MQPYVRDYAYNTRIGQERSEPFSGATTPPRTLHLEENQQTQKVPQGFYSCYMDSTGFGGALRYDFSPDPSYIGWQIAANVQMVPSRGGQVAYATNRSIGPLEIRGMVRNTWDLFELSKFVQAHMAEAMYEGAPMRFVYPERDIDLALLIDSLTPVSIDATTGEIKEYAITAQITGDHTDINVTELSELALIDLPADIGWIDLETAYQVALSRFPQIVGPLSAGGGGGGTGEDGEPKDGDEGDDGETPPEEERPENFDPEGNPQQGPYTPTKPSQKPNSGGSARPL